MSINSKVLSFEAPNLYQTSLQLTTETDLRAWWAALVDVFSSNRHGSCTMTHLTKFIYYKI